MAKPHRLLDPGNFWLYSFYVILLSIASSALSEVLKGTFGSSSVHSMEVTALACFSLMFGFWAVWFYQFRRHMESHFTIVDIKPQPPVPASALIALCGPSPEDKRTSNPAYVAALYHRGTPPDRILQYLWLITSHSGEATAKWINEQAKGWGVKVHSPVVLDDTCAVDIIRLKVEEARLEAIEGYNIPEKDIICDFTGMTKPVTAGMILACAPKGRRLQYLQGQYDAGGKLQLDTKPVPIEITIQYEIEHDRSPDEF
jgi:hypothetical protein